MVLLHYKKTDHNQFLYETSGNRLIDDVINELVESRTQDMQLIICASRSISSLAPSRSWPRTAHSNPNKLED